jgi:hypothetical protein
MKWFQLAQGIVTILSTASPAVAVLAPFLIGGIGEAQQIHGSDAPEAKKAHVLNLVAASAAAVSATGKVTIDPTEAVAITQNVFSAIDSVHAIVKAQPTVTP